MLTVEGMCPELQRWRRNYARRRDRVAEHNFGASAEILDTYP